MVTSTRGTRGTRPERRFKVYQLHDSERRLLYVGYTSEPLQRRYDRHARQNAWFEQVDLERCIVDLYKTREDMMARYRQLRARWRQPAINSAPVSRKLPPPKPRRRTQPVGPPDGPTILSRLAARRAMLREAEDALGMPRGSAFWAADGSIDWRSTG